jgi:hypothetical protein
VLCDGAVELLHRPSAGAFHALRLGLGRRGLAFLEVALALRESLGARVQLVRARIEPGVARLQPALARFDGSCALDKRLLSLVKRLLALLQLGGLPRHALLALRHLGDPLR